MGSETEVAASAAVVGGEAAAPAAAAVATEAAAAAAASPEASAQDAAAVAAAAAATAAAAAAGEEAASVTVQAAGAGDVTMAAPAPIETKEEEEADAAEDSRPKIKETVQFLQQDMTLNVLPTVNGNVLMSLSDAGLQHFLACARSNVGVKGGRYMFEVKMLEILNPAQNVRDGQAGRTRGVLKIGLATEQGCFFLGETEESLCFDSDGQFTCNKVSTVAFSRFAREQVYAVVLNLEQEGPNANTVSLFRDGIRACKPMPLPENLKGKALFPVVTFRSLTVQVNFGAMPMANLPFKCRMIQDAAQADAVVVPNRIQKAGKYEVLFPISLPDEGTFDWLDIFLEKNPGYTELSERMLISWAQKSGLYRQKGYDWKSSNDKPGMQFGVPAIDDLSIFEVLKCIAPTMERNLVVMEVKSNLIKEERQALLKKFQHPHFNKVAVVVMGSPSEDFKAKTQELMLQEKQEKSDADFKKQQAEEQQKRLAMKRQREMEQQQRRQERAAKRLKRQQDEAAKKAAEAAAAALGQAPPEAETKEEEKPAMDEDKDTDPEPEDETMKEPEPAEPPKVELSAEEKSTPFRKPAIPDLTNWDLSSSFTNFTVPAADEGFDEVKYVWSSEAQCSSYLKDWVSQKKITTRIEDLHPGESFQQNYNAWQAQLMKWRLKQYEWKDVYRQKSLLKAAKDEAKKRMAQAKKEAEAAAAATAQALSAASAGLGVDAAATEAKEGEEPKPDATMEAKQEEGSAPAATEEPKAEEPKAETEEKKQEEPEAEAEEEDDLPPNLDDDDSFDVFGVEDVMDVGKGQPLFANWTYEDWALLCLRYEFHKLAHAYKQDVTDPGRVGIHIDHILFYYNKYFKKSLIQKQYGVETFEELIALVSDSVQINPKTKVLESRLSDELDNFDLFVKLTEECRRERLLRIDLGDNAAALHFTQALAVATSTAGRVGMKGARPGMPPLAQPGKGGFFGAQKGPQKVGYGGPYGGGFGKGGGKVGNIVQPPPAPGKGGAVGGFNMPPNAPQPPQPPQYGKGGFVGGGYKGYGKGYGK